MINEKEKFGKNIKFDIKKRFGIIMLDRTERGNALTPTMLKNLKNALQFCQNSDKIHGILLTGKGSSFTTGMDIDSIDASDHEAGKEYESIAAEVADILFNGKPVISAINGKAMGDGVAYALCSDYRIAIKESYFQMPEILISVFPGGRTVALMAKIIGIPWTKKILMFAEKINSETALKIGLVDEIVKDRDELMDVALKKVRFLSNKNQLILNLIKLSSNQFLDKTYNEAYELEKEAMINWLEGDDKKNLLKSFKNKLLSL